MNLSLLPFSMARLSDQSVDNGSSAAKAQALTLTPPVTTGFLGLSGARGKLLEGTCVE